MIDRQPLALSFVRSTNGAQDVLWILLVVFVTAFLIGVAARSIMQEHRGQEKVLSTALLVDPGAQQQAPPSSSARPCRGCQGT